MNMPPKSMSLIQGVRSIVQEFELGELKGQLIKSSERTVQSKLNKYLSSVEKPEFIFKLSTYIASKLTAHFNDSRKFKPKKITQAIAMIDEVVSFMQTRSIYSFYMEDEGAHKYVIAIPVSRGTSTILSYTDNEYLTNSRTVEIVELFITIESNGLTVRLFTGRLAITSHALFRMLMRSPAKDLFDLREMVYRLRRSVSIYIDEDDGVDTLSSLSDPTKFYLSTTDGSYVCTEVVSDSVIRTQSLYKGKRSQANEDKELSVAHIITFVDGDSISTPSRKTDHERWLSILEEVEF